MEGTNKSQQLQSGYSYQLFLTSSFACICRKMILCQNIISKIKLQKTGSLNLVKEINIIYGELIIDIHHILSYMPESGAHRGSAGRIPQFPSYSDNSWRSTTSGELCKTPESVISLYNSPFY